MSKALFNRRAIFRAKCVREMRIWGIFIIVFANMARNDKKTVPLLELLMEGTLEWASVLVAGELQLSFLGMRASVDGAGGLESPGVITSSRPTMVAKLSDNPDDFQRCGSEIYERSLRSVLEPAECGKFVAIDIDGEGWEVDEDDYTAARRVRERFPQARIWIMRVGSESAYRIGGSRKEERSK